MATLSAFFTRFVESFRNTVPALNVQTYASYDDVRNA